MGHVRGVTPVYTWDRDCRDIDLYYRVCAHVPSCHVCHACHACQSGHACRCACACCAGNKEMINRIFFAMLGKKRITERKNL